MSKVFDKITMVYSLMFLFLDQKQYGTIKIIDNHLLSIFVSEYRDEA